MYTFEPFFTYSPTISASLCQATMLCHSVRSCHWPLLSLYPSLVASENLATGVPVEVYLISGSFPRFPTRITLLTLLAMPLLRYERSAVNITNARQIHHRGKPFHHGGTEARRHGDTETRRNLSATMACSFNERLHVFYLDSFC